MSDQQSQKRGKQSTAQKRASSRHDFGPIPATSKVSGASGGNSPVGRTITEVMDDFTDPKLKDSTLEPDLNESPASEEDRS